MKKIEAILMTGIVLMSVFALVMPVIAQDTVVSIEDVSLGIDESKAVPIMIENVTGVVVATVSISYNSSVVHITGVANSDFCPAPGSGVMYYDINNTVGSATIIAQNWTTEGLTGNVRLAELTLEAEGDAGDWSYLNLTIDELKKFGEISIEATVDNGIFTITGVAPPYLVTYTISTHTITPPQTTEIDVEFSERVEAWIKIEDSNRNLVNELYHSTSVIDPTPKTWDGTYTNGTQVPDGDYYVNVTGLNTTTELSVVHDTEIITVTAEDETPPTITDVSPGDGATDVSVGTKISATFSEAMNEASAEAAFSVDSVTGTFSWAGNTMTFTPSANLAYNTTYTVTVSTTAEDLAGNNLASDYTWAFTTEPPDETPPTITDVSPGDGATDVSVGTTISATFSEAMNETTTAAFSISPSVAGEKTWDGNKMTFTPSANLAYSTTYTVTISTEAADLAGNNLAGDYTWSFTTESRRVSRGGGGGAPRDSDGDGYSDVEEMLAGTDPNDPNDYPGAVAATPAPKATPTPTVAAVTPTPTMPAITPTPTPAPTEAPEEPGFEAAFAIAGLLAVAYLVLRRKRK